MQLNQARHCTLVYHSLTDLTAECTHFICVQLHTVLADIDYDPQSVVHDDHILRFVNAGALYVPPSGPTPVRPSTTAEGSFTPQNVHAQGNESNSPADETIPEPSDAYQVRVRLGCMVLVLSVPLGLQRWGAV